METMKLWINLILFYSQTVWAGKTPPKVDWPTRQKFSHAVIVIENASKRYRGVWGAPNEKAWYSVPPTVDFWSTGINVYSRGVTWPNRKSYRKWVLDDDLGVGRIVEREVARRGVTFDSVLEYAEAAWGDVRFGGKKKNCLTFADDVFLWAVHGPARKPKPKPRPKPKPKPRRKRRKNR